MAFDNELATATIEQVAEILGICRASAYKAAARGEIPSIRIGGRLLVPRTALEQLLSRGASRLSNSPEEK